MLIIMVIVLAMSLLSFALMYIIRDRKKDDRLARIEERLKAVEERRGK